jgi:hypothetical protein
VVVLDALVDGETDDEYEGVRETLRLTLPWLADGSAEALAVNVLSRLSELRDGDLRGLRVTETVAEAERVDELRSSREVVVDALADGETDGEYEGDPEALRLQLR